MAYTEAEVAAIKDREARRWFAIAVRTEPRVDREKLQAAFDAIYRRAGRATVPLWVADGPMQAMAIMEAWQTGVESSTIGMPFPRNTPKTFRQEPIAFLGSLEAEWVGIYRTEQLLGTEFLGDQLERLAEYEQTVLHGYVAWPMEHGVIASERPIIVRYEEPEPHVWRLHCPDGPALAFRDGYEVYAWHGVRVPKQIIMDNPDTWTLAAILNEQNAEVRRVMLERFGGDRLRDAPGLTVRDEYEGNRLLSLTMPDGERPYVFLDLEDSTPLAGTGVRVRYEPTPTGWQRVETETGVPARYKRYALAVPPETQRVMEGIAWTFRMTEREYVLSGQS